MNSLPGLGLDLPREAAADPRDLAAQDEENTLAALQSKVVRGIALKAHEKKALERMLAASDGRRVARTLDELAAALGVTSRTVKNWKKAPDFPRTSAAGVYDVAEVEAWRGTANPQPVDGEEEPPEEGEKDKDFWETLRVKEQALRERLKRQREEGLLVDRPVVERMFAERIGAVKTGLLALPRVIARDINPDMTPNDIRDLVEKKVRALLDHYARPLPKEYRGTVDNDAE